MVILLPPGAELEDAGATLEAAEDTLTACEELTTGAELIAALLELVGSLVPVQPANAADINTASGIRGAFMVSPLLVHLRAMLL